MTARARTREVAMLSMRPFQAWAIAPASHDSWRVGNAKPTTGAGTHYAFANPSEFRGKPDDFEVNV